MMSLLQQVEKEGRTKDIRELMHIIQSQPKYKLLAANLLLQLDVLEDSYATNVYWEEATKVLLESVVCEESPTTHKNPAFLLSNLGETYTWKVTMISYVSLYIM